jgi:selenocysteine lyase/cysteine desulfurase
MPYFPEAPPAGPIEPAADFKTFRDAYRADTKALRKFIYLNHASVGPLSDSVIAAVIEQLQQQQMEESIVQDPWFDGWRLSRQRIAELLGATRDDVCNLTNTWDGVTRAVNALPLGHGDEALVPADEFPSVYYALSDAAARGVDVIEVHASRTDRIVRTEDVLNAITPRTKLIAISTVCFMHGYRHDLEALAAACQDHGIWLVLDVIQSLGQLALDAPASGAHFVAGQGAKWLCAPLGSGYLYVSKTVPAELHPRTQGWFAMELNHDAYTDRNIQPKLNANRFGTGTVALPSAFGLRRAAEIFLEAGPLRCQQAALHNSFQLEQAARAAGLEVYSDRSPKACSAIISLNLPAGSPIPENLRAANVVFSIRNGKLRLSPHWYTTEEEIGKVADILTTKTAVSMSP